MQAAQCEVLQCYTIIRRCIEKEVVAWWPNIDSVLHKLTRDGACSADTSEGAEQTCAASDAAGAIWLE